MTDLFDEVDEQLRADRLQATLVKTAPLLLGFALVLIIGAFAIWGWNRIQTQATARASEAYAHALESLAQGKPDQAFGKFGEAAKSAPKAYKALSLMQQGTIRLSQNRPKDAVVLFDQAASAAPDPIIGDVARLKAIFALLDTASFKDIEARIKPLLEDGRPYRLQALEALAFAKLLAGDLAGARGDFVVISLLPDASDSVQRRAEAAMAMIDSGSAKALGAAVKAAATAPPAAMLPPGSPATAPEVQPQPPGPQ